MEIDKRLDLAARTKAYAFFVASVKTAKERKPKPLS